MVKVSPTMLKDVIGLFPEVGDGQLKAAMNGLYSLNVWQPHFGVGVDDIEHLTNILKPIFNEETHKWLAGTVI